MSPRPSARAPKYAPIFAALGDETRLMLVAALTKGERSISALTEGTRLTRQAVTKHLNVLEDAGLVRHKRAGRESLYRLDLKPFADMEEYMQFVSGQWDRALSRLKAFAER